MGQQDGVTVHVLGVDAFDLRFGMKKWGKVFQVAWLISSQ